MSNKGTIGQKIKPIFTFCHKTKIEPKRHPSNKETGEEGVISESRRV